MKTVTFYLDFISPYAWLAFDAWPRALEGVEHHVVYRPILFGALLKHHGQLGPAEIAGKREWTYRQVMWLAHRQGTPLVLPASHPFNPLALLRLALACDERGAPGRQVCERIFRHVWCEGQEAADSLRRADLTAQLAPVRDPSGAEVRQDLHTRTREAVERGVFGVPSFEVDGRLFWGQDALPMLRACLLGDPWFEGPAWSDAGQARNALRRQ
ncbi:2-hydroxychromene-2-carboxylate isomerase [Limnohabitans sp.]|uniref:2-hydroxychromene-2-carboxylate isomerase n=1 Tax=Limnohabitans sp. TaxID=1907725 RepID=UPI00391961EE